MGGHSGQTVLSVISKQTSAAVLTAVGVTSLVQTLVTGEAGVGAESLMQSVVQIGGPTALGALAANTIVPLRDSSDLRFEKLAMRGAIAGGVACGVLILAGALPMQVDAQLLSLAGLVGLGAAAGDIVAMDLDAIFGGGK